MQATVSLYPSRSHPLHRLRREEERGALPALRAVPFRAGENRRRCLAVRVAPDQLPARRPAVYGYGARFHQRFGGGIYLSHHRQPIPRPRMAGDRTGQSPRAGRQNLPRDPLRPVLYAGYRRLRRLPEPSLLHRPRAGSQHRPLCRGRYAAASASPLISSH